MAKHYENKSKKLIYIILLVLFIILLIISSLKIIEWYRNNKKNEKILEEISQAITVDETQENQEDKYNVDFEALKEKNSDLVAWIKVNGTQIEYPVVKHTDNDFYINHSFDKSYNNAGWIFADYKNKFDGTDKNIVIYGHNRRDNSLFGTLKNILTEEWYNNEENKNIVFITENENSIYEVFSVYRIEAEDYYIKTNFVNDEEFAKFIETIKGRSKKDFNVLVNSIDTILTLSTCANDNRYRVVLHAKKVK